MEIVPLFPWQLHFTVEGGGQCSLKSSKSDFLFSHFTQYKCILFCHSSFFFFAPKFASQGCFFVKSLHFISFCNFPPSHPEPVWYIFLFLSPLDYLWWPWELNELQMKKNKQKKKESSSCESHWLSLLPGNTIKWWTQLGHACCLLLL